MQAFWVITLITILMVAVSASFLVSDIEENTTSEVTLVDGPSSSQADEESDDATTLQFGINESSEGMDANNLQVLQVFMAHLSSGMFALFNVIFLIIFVTADQKNGYIKNIGGQVKRRYRLIVAKWVAAAVYVLVFDAIMLATQVVALVATQGYLHWGSAQTYLPYIGIQMLLQYCHTTGHLLCKISFLDIYNTKHCHHSQIAYRQDHRIPDLCAGNTRYNQIYLCCDQIILQLQILDMQKTPACHIDQHAQKRRHSHA